MLHKHKNGEVVDRIRDVIFDTTLIPLGVAIEIPEGHEAHLLPRSGTFKKWGIIQTNSKGIIDRSFMGDNDEWKLPVIATRAITIPKGTRVAQFRIILSQKATPIQKIKWLCSRKPKLVKVECLGHKDRKGIGEGTGEK
jgi:dUTP pyrophosphatase